MLRMPHQASRIAAGLLATKSLQVPGQPLPTNVLAARSPQRAMLKTMTWLLNVSSRHWGIVKLACGVMPQVEGSTAVEAESDSSCGVLDAVRGKV